MFLHVILGQVVMECESIGAVKRLSAGAGAAAGAGANHLHLLNLNFLHRRLLIFFLHHGFILLTLFYDYLFTVLNYNSFVPCLCQCALQGVGF